MSKNNKSNNRRSDQISFLQHQRVQNLLIETPEFVIKEVPETDTREDYFDGQMHHDIDLVVEDVNEEDLFELQRDKFKQQNHKTNSNVSRNSNQVKRNEFTTSGVESSDDDNGFDMLIQVAQAEQDQEQAEEIDKDYMDNFFDRQIDEQRRRNRRTSPLWEKPDFLVGLKKDKPIKKYKEETKQIITDENDDIRKTNASKRHTVQLSDTIGFSNKLAAKAQQNLDNKSPSKFQKEERKIIVEDIEDEPEEVSINDETLTPEENIGDYLQQIQSKYEDTMIKLADSIQNSMVESSSQQQQVIYQVDQMRNLQDSIISSVTEMLANIEDNPSTYSDETLNFHFNQDFTQDFYLGVHQDVLIRNLSPRSKKRAQIIRSIISEGEWDSKDIVKIIDWNERRHRELAQEQLKINSVFTQANLSTSDVRIRVFTQFANLHKVSNKMLKQRQHNSGKATCVALTDGLILIGTSEGQLEMFDKQTEEDFSSFSEKSKDFLGNSVTSLDVHPLRPEYAVMGYERGQLVLIDVTQPKKSLKVIKDHHKVPVINIKFCDWQGSYFFDDNHKKEENMSEDKQAWMFISIDQQGRVIINSITKILFVLKASKHIIIDPAQYDGAIYAAIASRFSSHQHASPVFDPVPIVALGNAELVQILEVRPGKHQEFASFERPFQYYNRQTDDYKSIPARVPALSWGFGNSPVINERAHSLLAIAWGPMIQLIVLLDNEGADKQQPFVADGYYILRYFGKSESPFNKQQLGLSSSSRGSVSRASLSLSKMKEETKSPAKSLFSDDFTRETENEDFNQATQATSEAKEKNYDDSQAFNHQSLDIEQIQFFSDSTLLIITQSQELRILNVSAFHPDTYDPETERTLALAKKSIKDVSLKVELEYGTKISAPLQKSEYGAIFHQTIKFFQGTVIALTTKNVQVCKHITWQQSVYEFKRIVEDDLVQVFSRALDIYKGNVKGYAGLPDNSTVREQKLKTELKLLVREIIQQVITKTRQSTTSFLMQQQKNDLQNSLSQQQSSDNDQQASQLIMDEKEFRDERAFKYQTLIRIAIEFCVELKDQQFLFYDLFLLFKEEELEAAFIHELEPFIMAGKFQEWDLPNEVIQNHVLKYYKGAQKADALEKIIVNLNLNQCPKQIVLEFIHYSEQYFLTTAILYLYTQVFEKKDNTSCVQVIFSLFDLYKKAGKKNQGALIDIQNLKEFTFQSQEKQRVEKSQIYLGYKILWVIRMFLNGHKFPQGVIRTKKWKTYIHDIIELLQSNDILRVLLDIDAECFFQTISILFYPSLPFELFRQGRDDPDPKPLTTDQQQQQQPQPQQQLISPFHTTLVKSLDQYCMSLLASDTIKYHYLYFAANVIARSPIAPSLDPQYYYNITRELMMNNKRYIEYNRKLQSMADERNIKIRDNLNRYRKSKLYYTPNREEKYIVKTENDLLHLLQKSEPLDQFQCTELMKYAEYTQFNQVRILLLEKKEEYLNCLQMMIHEFKVTSVWTAEMQAAKVIKWISEKVQLLESKTGESNTDKNICEQFKREVTQNIAKILIMNPAETIHLIEDRFGGMHKEMIDQMVRDPVLQMLYLDTLLVEKESLIESTIKSHGLQSSNQNNVKRFIEFLKLHLRLCCQYQQSKVLSIVEKMLKNNYYPLEDCLEICTEYKQIEATFILNRKVGRYFDCIQQGLQILKNKLDIAKLKIELFLANSHINISTKYPVQNEYLAQCMTFDTHFKQILKICKKHCKEVEQEREELIWYIVIDFLTELKNDPAMNTKYYCKAFFKERIFIFSEELVAAVKFENYLKYILDKNRRVRFREFGPIILMKFYNALSEKNVLGNASKANKLVNTELFQELSQSSRRGILFRHRLCPMCKRYMDGFLYSREDEEVQDQQILIAQHQSEDDPFLGQQYDPQSEQIKIFACKHTFHMNCLEKYFTKRKKNESELAYLKRIEKLRCPTCNLKNYDLGAQATQRRTPRTTPKGPQPTIFIKKRPQQNTDSIVQSSSRKPSQLSDEQSLDKTELWERERQKRLAKEQSDRLRRLDQMQKRLAIFEQQNDHEGLNIGDFKEIHIIEQ